DFGKGVTKDDKQAVSWYRKAANQGHVTSQFNLGSFLKGW
ncbi:MAG: sel1 repeat family protein, partial [Prochlorococcus sp.]